LVARFERTHASRRQSTCCSPKRPPRRPPRWSGSLNSAPPPSPLLLGQPLLGSWSSWVDCFSPRPGLSFVVTLVVPTRRPGCRPWRHDPEPEALSSSALCRRLSRARPPLPSRDALMSSCRPMMGDWRSSLRMCRQCTKYENPPPTGRGGGLQSTKSSVADK